MGNVVWGVDPAMNLGMQGTISSGSTNILGSLTSAQLTILEKDVALIRYILQRTVPNYDELVTQFKAIEDIKEAEQWDR